MSALYENKDGKLVITRQFQLQRLQLKFPQLFPLSPSPIPTTYLRKIRDQLSPLDFHRGVVICSSADIFKPCFLYGILTLREEVSFTLMSAYRLLDIYLGNEGEELPSIAHITQHVVALYLGYSEMENRRQSDLLEQMMSLASVKGSLRRTTIQGLPSWEGQVVWLFYRGTEANLQAKYPRLLPLAKTLNYQIVSVFESKVVEDSDDTSEL